MGPRSINLAERRHAPGARASLPRAWTGLACASALLAIGVLAASAQADYTPTYFQTTLPPSGLSVPSGLAVDGTGDVFVVDDGSNHVVEGDVNGGPITPLFSGLNGPTDVALDAAGDVFVTDTGNNRVVELTAGGTQTTLPFSGLNTPWGVAVDGAGDVFVADALNNRVVELTGSGAQITLPFSALNTPAGVAVDRAGDVFVADNGNNRVVELTPSGTQRTLPFSGLNLPAGVAVDATASLSRGAWVCRERAEGRSGTSGDMAASRLSAREDRVLVGAESRTSVACSCTSCRRARRSSFDEVP